MGYIHSSRPPWVRVAPGNIMQTFSVIKIIAKTVKIVIEKSAYLAFVFVLTYKMIAVIDTDLGNGMDTGLVVYE